MKYKKLDEDGFCLFSKIICATADCVKIEFLCENAKKVIKEFAEADYRGVNEIDLRDQSELWQIYNRLGDHELEIEDKSVEIISYFLKMPIIDLKFNSARYWLFDWSDYNFLVFDEDWKKFQEESINELMQENFQDFKKLWLRNESGDDISCDTNFDLYNLAIKLGLKIERLFDGDDQLLVRMPITGDRYDSYYSDATCDYESLQYAN